MKINNHLLIEKINQAIISYNDNENDEQIDLITNGEISDADLLKIDHLNIDISDVSEEKESFFEELGNLLKNMELKGFYLYSQARKPIKMDLSFLAELNKNLKYLQIIGIDLSEVHSNIFSDKKQLEVLELNNTNISDLEFISQIDKNTAIDLSRNPVEDLKPKEIMNQIEQRQGKIVFNTGNPFYNKMIFALEDKQINLGECEIPEEIIEDVIGIFNRYNIQVIASLEDLRTLTDSEEKMNCPIDIIISGTKDISTQFLEEHSEITSVQIIDPENPTDPQQEEPYTREEFIQVRREIDKIKSQVEIPDEMDKDREKKIFAQLYKILGQKIEYNYYAITEEGKKDKRLQITCRNLYDALVKGKAVCAGFADALKNVSGEFGIMCKYISRFKKTKEEMAEYLGFNNEDCLLTYDENEAGHAWNSPKLDGENYLCDLTHDADAIKAGSYPLSDFCISQEDFDIQHEEFEFEDEGKISEISDEEQMRLFGLSEKEIEKRLTGSFTEDLIALLEKIKSQDQLTNCAVSISSEIKASDFDGIEQCFTKEEELSYDEKN